MAKRLAQGLSQRSDIQLAYPVQTNQIFAYFPPSIIQPLQARYPFYVWNDKTHLVRLVTSFDTTESEVDEFINLAIGKV